MKTSFVVDGNSATRLWLPVLVTRQDFVAVVVHALRPGPAVPGTVAVRASSFTGKREIENRLKEHVMARGLNDLRAVAPTPEEQVLADDIINRYFVEFR